MSLTTETRRWLQSGLGNVDAATEIEQRMGYYVPGNVYYVDGTNGSDVADGLTFDTPFATVQKAITTSNATIDWTATPKKYNYILVYPGVYAENLTPPYYAIVEGLGIRGTDTAAELHPATGSVFTGIFLGTVLRNLRMESNVQDTPILNLSICNNSRIESVEFALGANVSGVAAIDTDNATHLVVKDCDFSSGMLQNLAYAGYHRGGADKFAHNVQYLGNRIWAKTAGIWVQDTCTSSQMLIKDNFIWIDAGGKGVDDNNGASLVVNNFIAGGAGADAIEHAGGAGFTLFNQTNIAGVAAQETA